MSVTTSVKHRSAKRPQTQHKPQIVQAADFKRIPWLVHGFSTRPAGLTTCYGDQSLNLGFTKEDTRDHVTENRRQFLLALGAVTQRKPWPPVANRHVHSDIIHVVREPSGEPLAGDGIVTNLSGVAIAILTADCLPVLLVDRKKRAVGAFHAGWRGTVPRI